MNKRIIRRNPDSGLISLPEDIHPVLKRIYQNRCVLNADQIDKSLGRLLPYSSLKNISEAASILFNALKLNQKILVIGDFDADGATSTSVAVKCLKMFGAKNINYLVPNRFKYGYGLTPEIVNEAREIYNPDLIVTVDNGISSINGVETANALGIKVLVTDHHLAGQQLPDAETIVNPNQPEDEFPSKNLAGVGVIFYVMLALRSLLRENNWFELNKLPEPNLATVLDIVALGTVADVVPLDQNNRILVNQGLKRIKAGHACPGIQALLEVSNRNPSNIVATDLGFSLGPRLNAAGRLEDMSIGIQCLLSENILDARVYAQQLQQLNEDRKQIEKEMQQQAFADLKSIHMDEEQTLPMGVCLFDPAWHQGVIGILASRVKDKIHRPVIVFAQDSDDTIKGSARSIPNIHIRDALDSIATRYPDLITKFGGHSMAAGLTIRKVDYEEFKKRFDEEITRQMKPEYMDNIIYSDGELELTDFTISLADTLRSAEPWGQAFPEPVFDGSFSISQQRIVGEKHLKLVLKPKSGEQTIEAIAFNAVNEKTLGFQVGDELTIAYKLDINEFRGARNLQLLVEHISTD